MLVKILTGSPNQSKALYYTLNRITSVNMSDPENTKQLGGKSNFESGEVAKLPIDSSASGEVPNEQQLEEKGEEQNEEQLVESMKGLGFTASEHQLPREDRQARQIELDSRSIFVGNISPSTTPESLEAHFEDAGVIKRVTILYNKHTGAPKGYAYIEFELKDSVEKGLAFDQSDFNGKTITVAKKRTNFPGFNKRFNYQKHFFYQNQHQWDGVSPQWNYNYHSFEPCKEMKFYPQYQYQQKQYQNNYGSHAGTRYKGGFRRTHRSDYNKRDDFKNNYSAQNGSSPIHQNGEHTRDEKQNKECDSAATPTGEQKRNDAKEPEENL